MHAQRCFARNGLVAVRGGAYGRVVSTGFVASQIARVAIVASAALVAAFDTAQGPTMTASPVLSPPHVVELAPASGPATELVVVLHGVGDHADAFAPVAQALVPALPHATFLVPDGFYPWDGGGDGRQWFSLTGVTDANRPERAGRAAAEVNAWIDAELARRGLGRDRLVLVGFSQGAMVSSLLAVTREPRPLAVVAFSGRFPAAAGEAAVRGAPVPVLLVHGARDAVIP